MNMKRICMKIFKQQNTVCLKLLFLVLLLFACTASTSFAFDTEKLATNIAKSLQKIKNNQFVTIAFSRIRGELEYEKKNELIDFTNVAIVKTRKFRVIDRSKLLLNIREQKYNLSEFVSLKKNKELGLLLGVDLFLYGRAYQDILILKAIDVETSAIVWADEFPLKTPSLKPQTLMLQEMSEKVLASLQKDTTRFKTNKISQLSFWSIDSNWDTNQIMDHLSVALTNSGHFQIIDRENLRDLLREQKLSFENFINPSAAKKLGGLSGIDAFIYGNLVRKGNSWVASLKMMNTFDGTLAWADLIRFKNQQQLSNKKEVKHSNMIFIPEGKFIMGTDKDVPVSMPEHTVYLKSFYIDTTEVSSQQYQTFVKQFKHRSPPYWYGGKIPVGKENEPVVMINWNDASRYCRSYKKRLPTEQEWEKAFRGTNGRVYPWSESVFKKNWAKTKESISKKVLPVFAKTKDISIYGVYHLAGNVREWVKSVFKPYPGNQITNPKFFREFVVRGGSWALDKTYTTGWSRTSAKATFGGKDIGFRCAKNG